MLNISNFVSRIGQGVNDKEVGMNILVNLL